MYRALFCPNARARIRSFSPARRIYHLALARNDHEKDIGNHDGAEHRAEMNVGTATTEKLSQTPREYPDQNKKYTAECRVVFAQG